MRDGNGSYFCGTCGGDVKVLCGEKVWWIWEVRDWEEERVVLRSLRESQGLGKAWWDVEDSEDGGEEKGEEVEGGEGAAEKVAGEADDEMVVDARLQEKSK